MKTYNYKEAERLTDEFKALTSISYTTKGRTPKEAYLRALHYEVLRKFNHMNDRMIMEFYRKRFQVKKNRSAILQSAKNLDVYYTTYPEFASYYDEFFMDRADEKTKEVKKERKETSALREDLQDLLSDVPENKLREIKEMLGLRIKSWDWKIKDEYEIIEGGERIDDFIF